MQPIKRAGLITLLTATACSPGPINVSFMQDGAAYLRQGARGDVIYTVAKGTPDREKLLCYAALNSDPGKFDGIEVEKPHGIVIYKRSQNPVEFEKLELRCAEVEKTIERYVTEHAQ